MAASNLLAFLTAQRNFWTAESAMIAYAEGSPN
jgi:hypothetical protein